MTVDSRISIAHILLKFDIGGMENGLVNLINGLAEHKYRHTVICIDDFSEFARRIHCRDVRFVAIRKKPGTDVRAIYKIFRVLRELDPDIVHTRNLAGLDGLLPALAAGVQFRVHSEHGWDVNDLQGTNRRLQILRKLHRPLVSSYVALSQGIERYLIDTIGVASEKVQRICNGVDTDRFSPCQDKFRVRERLGMKFPADAILIGTVGRMSPVKNPLLLIEAFALAVKSRGRANTPLRLVIAGDGELRDEVERNLRRHGLSELSWLPGAREDIPEVMKSLDIFALPSLAEGISNTVLEAMATGLPVVATDVGGNTELVSHGRTGFVVESANARELSRLLCDYIDDKQLRDAHGREARRTAECKFSIDTMIHRYDKLYSSCKPGARGAGGRPTRGS